MSEAALDDRLDALSACGADRLDPARFAYLRSLVQRAHQQNDAVSLALQEKAQAELSAYQAHWLQAREDAEHILQHIGAQFPAQSNHAQQLADAGELQKLQQLDTRLKRTLSQQQQLRPLSELTSHLNSLAQAKAEQSNEPSFDELLQQQENQALAELGQAIEVEQSTAEGGQIELQSMKHFRVATKHYGLDQMIDRAINEGPENPGPLNPQMLAIKSLTSMRDLSPKYLRRFGAYIDSLLWLEKAGARLPSKAVK